MVALQSPKLSGEGSTPSGYVLKQECYMPLKRCQESGKPGWKWGNEGKCYTYTKGNPDSEKRAKKKAIKQGIAIEGPDKFKDKSSQEEKAIAKEKFELRDYLED